MEAARREADDGVAGCAPRAVDQVVACDEADACPGEVELGVTVDARQLGRLAADQHAARGAADLRSALDEVGDLFELDVGRRDVVEEEERLGAAAEDVVDAVGGEIHAAVTERAGAAVEEELRADAVGRRGEQAPVVECVEAGELAEARRAGGLDGGAQPPDDGVRGGEGDAGGLVRLRSVLCQEYESTSPPGWTPSPSCHDFPPVSDPRSWPPVTGLPS